MPTSGTVIKLIAGDVAWSLPVVPSEADRSATAPPGLRGAASEALFSLLSNFIVKYEVDADFRS